MRARGIFLFASVALFVIVASAAAQLAIPSGGGPIEVGPVPDGLRSIDPSACGRCHRDHLREWRASSHSIASTSPLFLAELRDRPLPSCARCHAPRGEREQGIDCAVCHVRDGVVLNPTVSGRAPHASRVSEELADERACASCHEFDFDGQPGERLQRTVSEWTQSRHASTSCQGCHLPLRGARHAHHFPGGLDETLLRDAIVVRRASARVDGGITRVELELEVDRAGHAVPTGDIFRRLEVRAWPAGRAAQSESVMLARRFRVRQGRWDEIGDRRVPERGSRSVSLELSGEHDRVEYAIDLWRAPPDRVERERWRDRDVRRRITEGVVTVDRDRGSD